MHPSRKIILQITIIACVSIFSLTSWILIEIPEHDKLSESYTLDQEYSGQNSIVNDVKGELSPPFLLHDALSQDVVERNGNELTIHSVVSSKKAETNEMLFKVENTYKVDSLTRKHLDRDGKFFAFPPGVEKKDYDFFHPAVFFDDPMVFKGTDVISKLEVYIFETVTNGADISHAFQQFAPHQIFTDTVSRLYVEPTTGNVIRFEKSWENYLVENGERVNTVEIGRKETSSFTESIITETTIAQIENMYFNNVVLPSLFLSVIFVGGAVWILSTNLKKTKHEKSHLEQTDRQKNEFSSMIAHELKTPLIPIKSYLDMLIAGRLGQLTPQQLEKLDIIRSSAHSLNKLIDDLSEVQKLETGVMNIHKEENSLSDIINGVIIQLEPNLEKKGIKLHLELVPIKCNCDKSKISQVLLNLLTNAIDFSPSSNGKITISLSKLDNFVKIIVEDNGSGIPTDKLESIFLKYYQIDSSLSREFGGTGLGLAIVKGIVELHGGQISVESKLGEFTRFTIMLPLNLRDTNSLLKHSMVK
ncbi:MAG: DUF3068 domain-containing protein [Nitrosarchaeum sp.]|nr:DUF3068 domain-containing protein [Nitrosarchaeum sp.]